MNDSTQKTYKLFRLKNGMLYSLFVETNKAMPMNQWLEADIGALYDETHVKSRTGPLALRPGFHSTKVPFTDWIGKKENGKLVQRKQTVWCECLIRGSEDTDIGKNGKRSLPNDWYRFKTKPNQPFPWFISKNIMITRILPQAEVEAICRQNNVTAQLLETS